MLAIIGGTGVYRMPRIEILSEQVVETPFGLPSSPVIKGRFGKRDILFIARHGQQHQYLPHEVNYRANLFALKAQGATQVIGISAVGSLQEALAPGDLVVPEQYFDWTRGRRASTFFGNGVAAHVSTAAPVSAELTWWIKKHAERLDIRLHTGATYACVEGPRLGTRAESLFLRQTGCHVVGMTNIPEVFLAREAQLCYATIGVVTDYDCWLEDPQQHVQANAIFALYTESLKKVYRLLDAMLADDLPAEDPEIRGALSQAILTAASVIPDEHKTWLQVLQR
jgi:5'-methylthioadenosine phosphorylase